MGHSFKGLQRNNNNKKGSLCFSVRNREFVSPLLLANSRFLSSQAPSLLRSIPIFFCCRYRLSVDHLLSFLLPPILISLASVFQNAGLFLSV